MPEPAPSLPGAPSLRQRALQLLRERDVAAKIQGVGGLDLQAPPGAEESIAEPDGLPGRPERPRLVAPRALKERAVGTPEGRAALLHSLAHIELNAVDLALDLAWRFPGLPDRFYRQWLVVAQEEAQHFELLRTHLASLGHGYGDFDAHNGLWEMAEKTKHDLLARIALVPRTLEARGLDASPAVKARLLSVGDARGGEILDVILRDEIGHVALGNHWFRWLCERDGHHPVATFERLAARHAAPRLRPPFNLPARRAAGFTEEELARLLAPLRTDEPARP